MATSGSSFQKKTRSKFNPISGTRPSLHNNQLLISTGIPSLDNCLGGGLAVGAVLLIEEDRYGSYGKLMLKYFIAEGVVNKHATFLASADVDPDEIIEELPGPIIDDPAPESRTSNPPSDGMKIAWRYQHQPEIQSSLTGMKFGHYYDLTKSMPPDVVRGSQTTLCSLTEETTTPVSDGTNFLLGHHYAKLLWELNTCLQDGGFTTGATSSQRNILRIGLHSLGSPQWGALQPDKADPSLPRFLYALKSLMRTAYAACVVTVPTHLFHDLSLRTRLVHMSDTAVSLESFAGSNQEQNPSFREYHGLFHIRKLPRLNSLTCHVPDTLDLAFKLRRKKFMIERLHLPPELSDTASRSQEDPLLPTKSAAGCAVSKSGHSLEF